MLVSGCARMAGTVVLILRAKAVALWLGPQGIGLMGLLQAMQEIGSQVADGGSGHSAVRRVAQVRDAKASLTHTLRTLGVATIVMGAAAAGLFAVFSSQIASIAFGDPAYAPEIMILGAGIGLGVAHRNVLAVMAGLQQVVGLARVTISAACLATIVGLCLVWKMGLAGLVWAVVAYPAAHLLAAILHGRRVHTIATVSWVRRPMIDAAREIYGPGLGLMLSALSVLAAPLIIRIWLTRTEGFDTAGLYQAGLVIAMHTGGLLLAAVAADLYPRLSAVAASADAMYSTALTQTRLHLAVGGPIVLAVLGFSTTALWALYATPFQVAAPMLQWMLIGTLVRLVCVPIEMTLTAQARTGAILVAQILHQGLVITVSLGLFADFGFLILGVAFLAGQLMHLGMLVCLSTTGARVLRAPHVAWPLAALLATGMGLTLASEFAPDLRTSAALSVCVLAALAGVWAIMDLRAQETPQTDATLG